MEVEKTINKLQEIKEAIINKNLNPDDLSRAALKMSGYLIRLGEFVADYVHDANNAYVYRKFKYASDFSTLSKNMPDTTISKLSNMAQIQNKEFHDDENEKRHTADRLKTLHEDFRLFVMVLQTRLSVMKSELFTKKEI